MSIENLRLVNGKSFEQIIKLLNTNNISYDIYSHPKKTNNHFRESYITLNLTDQTRVEQFLGKPSRKSRFSCFYYASYKINPEFDWTILSGNPHFSKGLLIESIGLNFKKVEK